MTTQVRELPVARKAKATARPAPLHGVPLSLCLLVLGALLVLAILVAAAVGSVSVSVGDSWRIVWAHLTGSSPGVNRAYDQIVWNFRIPRVLLAALCGAGLAVSGVVLQALV